MALRMVLRRLSAATLVPAARGAVPRRVLPSARRALAAPPSTPDDDDDDADDEPPVEHELIDLAPLPGAGEDVAAGWTCSTLSRKPLAETVRTEEVSAGES